MVDYFRLDRGLNGRYFLLAQIGTLHPMSRS